MAQATAPFLNSTPTPYLKIGRPIEKADGPGVADEPLTRQSDTAIYNGLCWHSLSKSANKPQLQISRKPGKAPPA